MHDHPRSRMNKLAVLPVCLAAEEGVPGAQRQRSRGQHQRDAAVQESSVIDSVVISHQ